MRKFGKGKGALLIMVFGSFFLFSLFSCSGDDGKTTPFSTLSEPYAEFSASQTTGDSPLTVAFTDLSLGGISTWSWDFGDGGTSTEQNPSHDYVTAGTYTVSLTVTGTSGSDTNTKVGYITVTNLFFTDDFNRANENPIGGNWSPVPNNLSDAQILNNELKGTVFGASTMYYWNAGSFNPDQYSQIKVSKMIDNVIRGVAVRIRTDTQWDAYVAIYGGGICGLGKYINGVFSQVGNWRSCTLQEGDIVRLEAIGTIVSMYINNTLAISVNDSTITSGAAGVYPRGTNNTYDDWEGGSL